ncbi:MAG: hypothetical protein AAF551_09450, partial [Bacteroidota bacterium]
MKLSSSNEYKQIKEELNLAKLALNKKNRELSVLSLQMMSFQTKMEELMDEFQEKDANNKFIKRLSKQYKKDIGFKANAWINFRSYFENVHPEFIENLTIQYPDLSQNEIKLLAFLKMNMNNKQIAEILNVTVGAISQSKRRLKKKLGLLPEDNLFSFIVAIQ